MFWRGGRCIPCDKVPWWACCLRRPVSPGTAHVRVPMAPTGSRWRRRWSLQGLARWRQLLSCVPEGAPDSPRQNFGQAATPLPNLEQGEATHGMSIVSPSGCQRRFCRSRVPQTSQDKARAHVSCGQRANTPRPGTSPIRDKTSVCRHMFCTAHMLPPAQACTAVHS